MLQTLHLVAQYLAAASINYGEAKADDSHTNLEWSTQRLDISSRPFGPNEDRLRLDLRSYTLQWIPKEGKEVSYGLHNAPHINLLHWLAGEAKKRGFEKAFAYNLHYELPYDIDINRWISPPAEPEELQDFAMAYNTAHLALEQFLSATGLESEIRIWPHHFDLGAFAKVNEDLSVGLGVAVPDNVVDDYYFYLSGWDGGTALSTEGFSALSAGEWKNNGFKGAVLAATDVDVDTALNFYKEAVAAFQSAVGA